ncbi:MAG: c-type cytochrome [Proteobacteria bacterium]|nr:c-type cytochrome [Pseudomonadota bacterium]
MVNLAKVVAFSLLTIGFFAFFANFGIPEIKPAPPPVDEELDLSSMTMEGFVALGDRIFNGKGTCTLCHNPVGGRAPLLDDAAARIRERLRDPRYGGQAQTLEAYLRESMLEPSVFVVAGFGKAGTSDTESPMPVVSGGGIGMSEADISAVIAYLQDRWGLDITVEIPADVAEAQVAETSMAATPVRPLKSPQAAFTQFACTACHIFEEAGGQVGPNLSRIGAQRDREYLRRAILDPNADISAGFVPNLMPGTYAEQMYASELEMIVDYLAGLE